MYKFLGWLFLFNWTVFHSQIEGDWYGTLDAMGQKLPLVLHLKDSSGFYKGTMDSPNQKAMGIPMSSVSVTGKTLRFTIDPLRASYEGTLDASNVLVGTFKQGVFKAPLSFDQTLEAPVTQRKIQEPTEPYTYVEKEVTIKNERGGFNLSGTLTHPSNAPSTLFPCIILITGSGPQDRNEEILGHRPFLVLADRLTSAGFAVLRMDDRGTAKSEGDFVGATSLDFVQDIEAALAFVKTVPNLDAQKIILLGHSEGGMVANMVAARNPEVFGVISLAGPGVLGSTLLVEQQILISRAVGASKKEQKQIRSFSKAFYPLLTLDSLNEVQKQAESFLKDYAKRLSAKDLRKNGVNDRSEWVKMNLEAYVNPWMLYFLNYEPATDLRKIRCHYLALNGTTDLQVPAKMNLEAIAANCNPGDEKIKAIKPLDGLNHLFQPSASGNPSEYGSIDITIDERAINEVLQFLLKIRN